MSRGSFAGAARRLGCTRQTVQNYCQREPELYVTCVQARETMLDDAEDALKTLVADGDLGAICFYLKTQGKARGYVERAEQAVTHTYDFSLLSDADLLAMGPVMAKLRGGPPPFILTAGTTPPPPLAQ